MDVEPVKLEALKTTISSQPESASMTEISRLWIIFRSLVHLWPSWAASYMVVPDKPSSWRRRKGNRSCHASESSESIHRNCSRDGNQLLQRRLRLKKKGGDGVCWHALDSCQKGKEEQERTLYLHRVIIQYLLFFICVDLNIYKCHGPNHPKPTRESVTTCGAYFGP